MEPTGLFFYGLSEVIFLCNIVDITFAGTHILHNGP